MAKQIIKGLTMLMIVVALAFVTSAAYGQSSQQSVAKIPFEFVVGDKSLPAGEYGVRSADGTGQDFHGKCGRGGSRLSAPFQCRGCPVAGRGRI